MWLTSNRPAAFRVALCSSTTELYQTGMSQPAKGTIFAPSSRWMAFSAVSFTGGSAGSSHVKAGRALVFESGDAQEPGLELTHAISISLGHLGQPAAHAHHDRAGQLAFQVALPQGYIPVREVRAARSRLPPRARVAASSPRRQVWMRLSTAGQDPPGRASTVWTLSPTCIWSVRAEVVQRSSASASPSSSSSVKGSSGRGSSR